MFKQSGMNILKDFFISPRLDTLSDLKKQNRLLLWHWGRRGGGPRYTYELAQKLDKHSIFDVHLSISEQCEIFSEFTQLALPTQVTNTYSGKVSALLSLPRLGLVKKQFQKYLQENRIDIVFCTMSHLWNIGMLSAIRKAGARFVLALHDAVPHPGENYLIRKMMLAKEIAEADGIVTLSRHVQDQLCEVYNYPRERIWVAPLGVYSYAVADKPKLYPKEGPLKILFFGRILPYKGLHILLEAFEMLEKEFSNIELSVIGSGDLTPYKEQIGKLKNVVIKNGWIEEEEIGPIFNNTDLLVMPYIEASQSGVVVAAYSAGVPAVATPIGGLVEQVTHMQDGYVARDTSPAAVAESIRKFITDPEFYTHCSANALKKVKTTMDWTVIAEQIAQAMQEAIILPFKRD